MQIHLGFWEKEVRVVKEVSREHIHLSDLVHKPDTFMSLLKCTPPADLYHSVPTGKRMQLMKLFLANC